MIYHDSWLLEAKSDVALPLTHFVPAAVINTRNSHLENRFVQGTPSFSVVGKKHSKCAILVVIVRSSIQYHTRRTHLLYLTTWQTPIETHALVVKKKFRSNTLEATHDLEYIHRVEAISQLRYLQGVTKRQTLLGRRGQIRWLLFFVAFLHKREWSKS